jgi:transposase-like protein
MLYSEDFKKQVVRKVLTSGVLITEVAAKLHISPYSIHRWKKIYKDEVRDQVPQVDLCQVLKEEPVDVEALLRYAEKRDSPKGPEKETLETRAVSILSSGKGRGSFIDQDKYAILKTVRAMSQTARGPFLRRYGLSDGQLQLWEEELLDMSKETIKNAEYVKRLEEENKRLKKELATSERDNHELKVLIELKKKYHQLFESEEGKK